MNEKQKQFLDRLASLLNDYYFSMIRIDICDGATHIKLENSMIGDLSFTDYYNNQFNGICTYTPVTVEPYKPNFQR